MKLIKYNQFKVASLVLYCTENQILQMIGRKGEAPNEPVWDTPDKYV